MRVDFDSSTSTAPGSFRPVVVDGVLVLPANGHLMLLLYKLGWYPGGQLEDDVVEGQHGADSVFAALAGCSPTLGADELGWQADEYDRAVDELRRVLAPHLSADVCGAYLLERRRRLAKSIVSLLADWAGTSPVLDEYAMLRHPDEVKMTLTFSGETVMAIDRLAASLGRSQGRVVQEAIGLLLKTST